MRRAEAARTFVLAATRGGPGDAQALAGDLEHAALDAALVLGDAAAVGAALRDEPRPCGPRARSTPLAGAAVRDVLVFLGGERTDGLVACARALLDAGADPNAA